MQYHNKKMNEILSQIFHSIFIVGYDGEHEDKIYNITDNENR